MTTVDQGPGSGLRRRARSAAYLPLVLLALAQGIYISLAPPVNVRQSELGQVQADGTSSTGDFDPALGSGATTGFDGEGGGSTAGAVAGQAGVVGANPAQTVTAGPGSERGTAAAGDVSHCTPEGRQHGVYTFQQEAPGCVPQWPEGADNGGDTYSGVTRDKVKIVIFEEQPNEQIDAILSAQQLAMTEEDRVRIHKYGMAFANKYYENYGREVEFIRFKSACPISPPSLVQCKAEARKVIAMKPFAVIFGQSVYPELFDEWSRAGIVSLGGWNFADSYFTDRRPFRYDVFMTGTKAARHVIEYYCKKMANKPADHAGNLIHPTIGGRTTPRHVGIIASENPPLLQAARFIAQEIGKCDTAGGSYVPEVVTYVGDIDRAAEQQEAVSSKMINSGTTTVICWCGPLEMTGFARNFSAQQYYPEHLLPGIGLLDVDVIGRLYPAEQWEHAFGPSHVSDPRPFEQEAVNAAYAESGKGNTCIVCSLSFLYLGLAAQGIQFAGPNLTPLTFESGLLSSPGHGGADRYSAKWDWGPGDYGGYADVREVYWDSTTTSKFDGKQGGYITLNDGRRFLEGEWSSEFSVPVKPS